MKKTQLNAEQQQALVDRGYTYDEKNGCWTKGTNAIRETENAAELHVGSVNEDGEFTPVEGLEAMNVDAAIEHFEAVAAV